ncbi:Unknown protein sequence [Pseudomonas syringae pv. syringae]|nr:Unknown protein sequence [Pseudomonas syringae pv. aceris]KPB18741.1 Unknown protein sequence [Pseudomonas syringae pv. syringae]
MGDETALPFWVQVQIDFINQDNAIALQWVFKGRIHHGEASGDVADERHHGFFALGQL